MQLSHYYKQIIVNSKGRQIYIYWRAIFAI